MNNLLCRRFFPAAACVLLAIGGVAAQTSLPLSFGDALRQMQNGNRSLKIADKGIEAARAERDKLNALWYPSLQGAGTFVHLSEKIEVNSPFPSSPTRQRTLCTTSCRTTNSSAAYSTR